MTNLERVKKVVKLNFEDGDCGIFDCRNIVGDHMTTIYEDEEITIDICYQYSYFEVFGLTPAEFARLEKYYHELQVAFR